MKFLLLLLLIGLGCFAALQQKNLNAAQARITVLQDELKQVKSGLNTTSADLARAAMALAEAEASESAEAFKASLDAALKAKLADLKRIYDSHHTPIEQKRAELDRNLSLAEIQVQELESNPPQFSEYHSVRTSSGALSSTGVRTSAADRERLTAKHGEQVSAAKVRVAAIEAAIGSVNAELQRLQSNYDSAVRTAHEESRAAMRPKR